MAGFSRNLPNLTSASTSSPSSGPQGAQGAAGANIESFSIYMSSDLTATSGSGTVTPWADTLSNGDFPGAEPGLIYQDLNYGTLDLPAGTFTCGFTGKYKMSLSIMNQASHATVQFGITNISTGAWVSFVNNPNAAFPGYAEVQMQMVSGQVYRVQFYNDTGGSIAIPRISTLSYNSVNYPTLIWTLNLLDSAGLAGAQGAQGSSGPQGTQGVSGPQGAQGSGSQGPQGDIGPQGAQGTPGTSGTLAPESFAITLSQDLTYDTALTYQKLDLWRDTLDQATYPNLVTGSIFSSLSYGTLNLTDGTFTCGQSGTYYVSFPRNAAGDVTTFSVNLNIDGERLFPNINDDCIMTALVDLTVGQVMSVEVYSGTAPAVIYETSNLDSPTSDLLLNVVWSVSLQAPGSGGGGGGTVNSVVGGTAISVDSTDPANPIVNNTGVTSLIAGNGITVSSATGAVTIGNSGVRAVSGGTGITIGGSQANRSITNTGILSLATGAGIQLTGPAQTPTIVNQGIRSIVSGSPSTLTVVTDPGSKQATVTYTGGGGGGGGTVTSFGGGPGILTVPAPITTTGSVSARAGGFTAFLGADSITNPGPIPLFFINNWSSPVASSSSVWGYNSGVVGSVAAGTFTVPTNYSGLWLIQSTIVSNDANSRVGIVINAFPTPAYVACVGPSYGFASRQVASISTCLVLQSGWQIRVGVDSTSSTTIFRTIGGGSTPYTATFWSMTFLGYMV